MKIAMVISIWGLTLQIIELKFVYGVDIFNYCLHAVVNIGLRAEESHGNYRSFQEAREGLAPLSRFQGIKIKWLL